MFSLAGKGALVTGATGGIGEAVARVLHQAGANVAISGTKVDRLEALAADLKERVHIVPCNLSDRAAVQKLAGEAEAKVGTLDILVNNAGMTKDNLFMRMKDEEWDQVIAVDLTSAFMLSRAAVRNMMRRQWGRIVNITSISGIIGNPGQGNYAAAKAGLFGLTHSYATLLARDGVTANTIAPALIETEMVTSNPRARPDLLPVGRFGTIDEVAGIAVLLARNGYITGQTFNVNGGWYMS